MKREYLSSPKNPLLREYGRLVRSRSYREKTGKIAIEGPNLVNGAIQNGKVPQALIYTDYYANGEGKEWLDGLPEEVRHYIVPEAIFKKIAETESPRSVAAILPFRSDNEAELGNEKPPNLSLILDRLQDPGNMGTVIRTAAAAGVERIYYIAGSVDPYSPKVLRSTAGTIFSLSLQAINKPKDLIDHLKGKGVQVVTGSADSATFFWEADYRYPLALIVGNEAGGITPELQAAADLEVAIPLTGSVESLNVAIAAGIILYEIIRCNRV